MVPHLNKREFPSPKGALLSNGIHCKLNLPDLCPGVENDF